MKESKINLLVQGELRHRRRPGTHPPPATKRQVLEVEPLVINASPLEPLRLEAVDGVPVLRVPVDCPCVSLPIAHASMQTFVPALISYPSTSHVCSQERSSRGDGGCSLGVSLMTPHLRTCSLSMSLSSTPFFPWRACLTSLYALSIASVFLVSSDMAHTRTSDEVSVPPTNRSCTWSQVGGGRGGGSSRAFNVLGIYHSPGSQPSRCPWSLGFPAQGRL